jgi:signal peptidase I
MKSLTPGNKLIARHSKHIYWISFGLVLVALLSGWYINNHVISIYRVSDDSLGAEYKIGDLLLICKTQSCRRPEYGELTLYSIPQKPKGFLSAKFTIGLPGDTLFVSNGKFKNKNKVYNVTGDPYFDEPQYLVVPNLGESLLISKLTNTRFEFMAKLIQDENPHDTIKVRNQFFFGESQISDQELASIQIGERNLRLGEIHSLSWQQLDLINLNLERKYFGKPIRLARSLFLVDSLLTSYTVQAPYYFLLAKKSLGSLDSREFGFVASHRIKGRAMLNLQQWSFYFPQNTEEPPSENLPDKTNPPQRLHSTDKKAVP